MGWYVICICCIAGGGGGSVEQIVWWVVGSQGDSGGQVVTAGSWRRKCLLAKGLGGGRGIEISCIPVRDGAG